MSALPHSACDPARSRPFTKIRNLDKYRPHASSLLLEAVADESGNLRAVQEESGGLHQTESEIFVSEFQTCRFPGYNAPTKALLDEPKLYIESTLEVDIPLGYAERWCNTTLNDSSLDP